MVDYTKQSLEKVLSDPQTVAINRLATRSYYLPERSQCLNGRWDFRYDDSPSCAPTPEQLVDFETSLEVPGHWQLQGYGCPNYTNVQYPFNVNVPHPPTKNPTGTYRRYFEVPRGWSVEEFQLRLRFEGVDCCYHVFLNGLLVGYSEGSRNSAEFDITDYLRQGQNELWVQVYQWGCSSYIEDQDQWWLSGIFRDVWLLAFPTKGFIENFKVETDLDASYDNSDLKVTVDVNSTNIEALNLLITLNGDEGNLVIDWSLSLTDNKVFKTFTVTSPRKWTAEDPYLYNMVIKLTGKNGTLCSVKSSVGFRKVEMLDGKLKVNGRPILLRGVNRHDHHPEYGRAVPLEFIERDLKLMKQHNINAIRNSHYPNRPELYELANKYGFWIFEEADLECHGFFECVRRPIDASDDVEYKNGKRELFQVAKLFTSDNPDWENAYVDRAVQMVGRDRNHPCVIVWSLGNEAFFGRNHFSMAKKIRQLDSTRPLHYEGDLDAEATDMYSRMYPLFETMLLFANQHDKPLVLCEYGHAMGNGPGLIRQYQELFYQYPQFQGGFIWEWNNHGIKTQINGDVVYAYGGDFGEPVHDGVFCMDGLVNSKHDPTPGLVEYKKVIEPIVVEFLNGSIVIKNTFDFIDLGQFDAHYYYVGYERLSSRVLQRGPLQVPTIKSHNEAIIPIPPRSFKHEGKVILNVEFTTTRGTESVPLGHLVAWGQHEVVDSLQQKLLQLISATSLVVTNSDRMVLVEGQGLDWKLDKLNGSMLSLTLDSVQVFKTGPNCLSFWRSEINNDKSEDGPYWKKFGLHQMTSNVTEVRVERNDLIIVELEIGPPVSSWRFKCRQEYSFQNNQMLVVTRLVPEGFNIDSIPKYLPRVGYQWTLSEGLDQVKWLGRGPGESYADKKESQRIDIHNSAFSDLDYSYDYPQENGNHEDTEWLAIEHSDSKKLVVMQMDGKFGFKCSDQFGVDEAEHPRDICSGDKYVRLDYKQHGVGTAACGPGVLPQYQFLLFKEIEFTTSISIL